MPASTQLDPAAHASDVIPGLLEALTMASLGSGASTGVQLDSEPHSTRIWELPAESA